MEVCVHVVINQNGTKGGVVFVHSWEIPPKRATPSIGMSSKQLLRIKEVPVEVSTKLKQHDIITCKVNQPFLYMCFG